MESKKHLGQLWLSRSTCALQITKESINTHTNWVGLVQLIIANLERNEYNEWKTRRN